MYSDMRVEHTCTQARFSVKPGLPESIYHKEEKSLLPSVSNPSALIHCGFSRRRCVAAKQQWFLGTDTWSKFHSRFHHRFLLSAAHITRRYVPFLTMLPWTYHSKWLHSIFHSDGDTDLPLGTVLIKELFVFRCVGDTGWLMSTHRVPPLSSIDTHGLPQALPCTWAAI